jgi:predicted small secreted protein
MKGQHKLFMVFSVLLVLSMVLGACTTPQPVVQTVVVTQ